jgi:hypothetical protein
MRILPKLYTWWKIPKNFFDLTGSTTLLQCCGSGMFIPDPKTAKKERVEQKFVVIPFNVSTNFTKLKIILVLKC